MRLWCKSMLSWQNFKSNNTYHARSSIHRRFILAVCIHSLLAFSSYGCRSAGIVSPNHNLITLKNNIIFTFYFEVRLYIAMKIMHFLNIPTDFRCHQVFSFVNFNKRSQIGSSTCFQFYSWCLKQTANNDRSGKKRQTSVILAQKSANFWTGS